MINSDGLSLLQFLEKHGMRAPRVNIDLMALPAEVLRTVGHPIPLHGLNVCFWCGEVVVVDENRGFIHRDTQAFTCADGMHNVLSSAGHQTPRENQRPQQ